VFRLVRTSTLTTLRQDAAAAEARAAEAEQVVDQTAELREADCADYEAQLATLRQQLGEARADAVCAAAELETARAQVLLDAEDRVALRMLLRTAKKQVARTERVHVLLRYGRLHSVHATPEAAEEAAEAEGAERGGWTVQRPGAATPEASEVPWRIEPLALGAAR
jgi:hypothetical protein